MGKRTCSLTITTVVERGVNEYNECGQQRKKRKGMEEKERKVDEKTREKKMDMEIVYCTVLYGKDGGKCGGAIVEARRRSRLGTVQYD